MNRTALILTLVMMLALLCIILTIDFVLRWRREHSQEQKLRREKKRILHQCNEGSFLAQTAQPPAMMPDASAPAETIHCDLMGRPRETMQVILPPDGKLLHLKTPTKAVSDQFETIGQLLERMEHCRLSISGIEQLYKFAAILMSNNTEGCGFTTADLRERCSAEDIGQLLQSYIGWLSDLIKSKN